jgi:divalent metal cation (Fe/Co/Zn/Cd) transporter
LKLNTLSLLDRKPASRRRSNEIAFTEGAVAIIAGIVAGSIALIGFGLDAAIEGFASIVIVWRFTGWRTLSYEAEDRAQKLVAIQFFILAPYVAFESVRVLIDGSHAEESLVGIALAASSLVVMPMLGRANQRIGSRIGSSSPDTPGFARGSTSRARRIAAAR